MENSAVRGVEEDEEGLLLLPPGGRSTPPFHFPPPPPYPPPLLHHCRLHLQHHHLHDYAYAYAPSAPTAPATPPSAYHQPSQQQQLQQRRGGGGKHTFISTYGIEENIYEEICEARGAFENPYEFAGEDDGGSRGAAARVVRAPPAGGPAGAARGRRRSATEAEVAKVRRGHRRVLGELNLTVEAMLMPPSPNGDARDDGAEDDEDDAGAQVRRGGVHSDGEEDRPSPLSPSRGEAGGVDSRGTPFAAARGHPYLQSGCSRVPGLGGRRPAPMARSRGTPPPPPPADGGASGAAEKAGAKGRGLLFKGGWRRLAAGPSSSSSKCDEPRWDETTRSAPAESCGCPPGTGAGGCRAPVGGAAAAADGCRRRCRRHDPARALTHRRPSSETDSWGSEAAESDRPLTSGCSSSSASSTGEEDEEDDEEGRPTPGGGRRRLASSFDERSCASAPTTIAARASGNLRSTLNKARTLCDKWRESRGRGREGGGSGGGNTTLPSPPEQEPLATTSAESRLSRWFSIRRNQYDVDRGGGGGGKSEVGISNHTAANPPYTLAAATPDGGVMPLLAEEEDDDEGKAAVARHFSERTRAMTMVTAMVSPADVSAAFPPFPAFQRRHQPPALPPPPPGLTTEQIKRRHIVAAIVHSENSYVATLQRLANDYKKPLEESSPPILSAQKIATLFHRVPEILQCHTLFRIALTESVRNWDKDEVLGDVFVASFSKAVVLEIYSDFINNFSIAMDLAKQESKRKSALADFLKVKQISAHDRLSFFGLMVKPVQRFPQFILFLQDLLKHTPHGHHDRMSLQLALTQLESLAEMLNERKREAEQYQAFREMLRHVGGKFAARPLVSDGPGRYLLREDNVTQLAFNQSGMITKTKARRLLLLNDLLVCVSVASKSSDDFGASGNERLTLKWTHPVTDVEVLDSSASPTLSRLLTACGGGSGGSRGGSLKSERSTDGTATASSSASSSCTTSSLSAFNAFGVDDLCQEMNALMHDYEVVSRIADLISTLKGTYAGMNLEGARRVLASIQASIQHKDEEIAWVDSCCLQISLRGKSGKEEQLTFQTDNPSVKKEWATELRLAQLALDPNNSPAWDIPEQERRPSTKMPLFVRAMPIFRSLQQTEVSCGCFYTIWTTAHGRRRRAGAPKAVSYLWVCTTTTDGVGHSHVSVLSVALGVGGGSGLLKAVDSFDLVGTHVTAMEYVGSSLRGAGEGTALSGDTVWMALNNRRLIVYNAHEPEKQEEVSSTNLPAVATQIKHHCDQVFVALTNGSLLLFHRGASGDEWCLQEPRVIPLAPPHSPLSCLLPINVCLYAASGKVVWALSALTGEIQKDFRVQHEHLGDVSLMAHSGVGLWLSFCNSSTICLYHTETFKHLQDISVAASVARVVSSGRASSPMSPGAVHVTALMACRGLLWVGTNVGVALTIPLPRLEGVPIISGRVNISHHAHCGPITFLLPLIPRPSHCLVGPLMGLPHIIEEGGRVDSGGKEVERSSSNTSATPSSPCSASSGSNASPLVAKGSPVGVMRRRSSPRMGGEGLGSYRRASKTLPRGLGGSNWSSGGSQDYDVYGLYGELMNVRDYEGEGGVGVGGKASGVAVVGVKAGVSGGGCQSCPGDVLVTRCFSSAGAVTTYEKLRRSDPELAAIPAKVSTLDRRLKMKVCRPRSLDLSDWSVDSRSSSAYTSSGSEESVPVVGVTPREEEEVTAQEEEEVVKVANPSKEGVVGVGIGGGVGGQPQQQPSHQHQQVLPRPHEGVGVKVAEAPRTIITLMGGRGYVDWRRITRSEKGGLLPRGGEANVNDAHIVVWEMKL